MKNNCASFNMRVALRCRTNMKMLREINKKERLNHPVYSTSRL